MLWFLKKVKICLGWKLTTATSERSGYPAAVGGWLPGVVAADGVLVDNGPSDKECWLFRGGAKCCTLHVTARLMPARCWPGCEASGAQALSPPRCERGWRWRRRELLRRVCRRCGAAALLCLVSIITVWCQAGCGAAGLLLEA